MKTALKISFVLLSFVLVSLLSFGFVHAGTATTAEIFTSTTPNLQGVTNQFYVGQTVYIGWLASPSGSTVDISVTDPNSNPVTLTLPAGVTSPTDLPTGDSFQVSFSPQTPGTYIITISGQTIDIAVITVTVLPESIAGALMPIATGFAAVGAVTLVKIKRPRPQ